MDLLGLNPHATEMIFLTTVLAKNGAYLYIVLRVMRLTYPRIDLILELCRAFPIVKIQ